MIIMMVCSGSYSSFKLNRIKIILLKLIFIVTKSKLITCFNFIAPPIFKVSFWI